MGPCNSASVKPTSNGTSARKNTLTNRPDLAHDLAGTQINPPACDTGPTSLINATNNIVSIAIAKSISNCFADQIALQNTRIKCKPRVPEDITVFEANAACGQCIQNILLASQRQNEMERILWTNTNPAQVRLPIDQYYASIIQEAESCGLSYCKACVLTDITQMNIVQSTDQCISTFMTNTNIQSNLTTLIQQQFLNNQDVLAAAAQVFASKDVSDLTDTVTNNLMAVVNTQFLEDLQKDIQTSQIIQLTSDTQVSLSHVSQSSISVVAQKFVDDNNVAVMAFGEEIFSAMANIVTQQNTLNSVGQAIFQSTLTFTSAINSSVGLVMFAMIIVLGVTVLAILGFLIYTRIQGGIANRAREEWNPT